MNDERPVTSARRQERLANPQYVVFGLIRDGYTGSNSGMDEKSAMIRERQRKPANPGKMFLWKLARISDTIAIQRLLPAIGPPIDQVGIRPLLCGGSYQHFVVIAAQADDMIGPALLPADQDIENLSCVRPAVNIVANEDEPSMPSGLDRIAGIQKVSQLVKASMNITDCKCDDIVQHANLRSSRTLGKEIPLMPEKYFLEIFHNE